MRSLPSLGHAERVEQSTCSHSIATWQMMGLAEQVGEVAGLRPFSQPHEQCRGGDDYENDHEI